MICEKNLTKLSGIPYERLLRAYDPCIVDAVEDAIQRGATDYTKISRTSGKNISTISKFLRDLKITHEDIKIKRIIEIYKSGVNDINDAARIIGISPETIRRYEPQTRIVFDGRIEWPGAGKIRRNCIDETLTEDPGLFSLRELGELEKKKLHRNFVRHYLIATNQHQRWIKARKKESKVVRHCLRLAQINS